MGQPQKPGKTPDSHGVNENDLHRPSDLLAEMRKQTALQERTVMALEKLVELIRAYSSIEEATRPTKAEKRVRRTPEEISRIVADAIKLVKETGWSDSRIAREIGVDRGVFCAREPYVEARLEADKYFSKADPDTGLE